MTFESDPMNEWERSWRETNPEPHVEGPWSFPKTMERVAWHKKRYVDYLAWCQQCGIKPR